MLLLFHSTVGLGPALRALPRAARCVLSCGIRPPRSQQVAREGDLSRRARRRKRGALVEQVRELRLDGADEAAACATMPFRYLAVLDVEATCEQNARSYVHEIIEFPVVLVDLYTREVCGEFHSYVRPTANKTLTKFCTKLTGIEQSTVDDAPTLDIVLQQFDSWLDERGLQNTPTRRDFAFAADGPWDLKFFLDGECKRKGIPKPVYFDKWVNIKQLFADYYRCRTCKIHKMLEKQGMRFEGRLHSGIDDTRNIARIAMKMAEDGCKMYVNEALPPRQNFLSL